MERFVIELYDDAGVAHPQRRASITVPIEYAKAVYEEIASHNFYNYLTAHAAGILDVSITCAESILASEEEFDDHLKEVVEICDRLIPKRVDIESPVAVE